MAGKARIRCAASTRAAAAAVWAVLADPYSYAYWVSGTARVRTADAQWPRAGARLFHQFGPWPLRVRDCTTVLDCEPMRRIVLAARARPFGDVRAEVTLTGTGREVRVVFTEELVGGLGARLSLIGTPVQRSRVRRSLRRLIALAERDGTGIGDDARAHGQTR